MNKSLLINYGGQGCIFNPSIPCKGEKKTKKANEISKILFKDDSANREFRMNKMIKKIEGYEDWCVLWEIKCKTPSYSKLKEISEFDKCISQKNKKMLKKSKKKLSYKKKYTMLKGPFGGELIENHVDEITNSSTFKNKKLFTNFFLKIFSYIHSLFIGLVELNNNNICHQDINTRNILYKNNQLYFIDFGLSSKFSNKKENIKRLKIAYNNDRIYDSFPYDYTLYHPTMNKKNLKDFKNEYGDFNKNYFRIHHDDYLNIHTNVLNRDKLNEEITHHMKQIIDGDYNENIETIIKSLDVYSLGYIIPQILYDTFIKNNIPLSRLKLFCLSSEISEHIELFKRMTEYHSRDRISPESALEIYTELQSKNKFKSVFQ